LRIAKALTKTKASLLGFMRLPDAMRLHYLLEKLKDESERNRYILLRFEATKEMLPEFFGNEYDLLLKRSCIREFKVDKDGKISFQAVITHWYKGQKFFLAAYRVHIDLQAPRYIAFGSRTPTMKVVLEVTGTRDTKTSPFYYGTQFSRGFCFGDRNPFIDTLLEKGEVYQAINSVLESLGYLNKEVSDIRVYREASRGDLSDIPEPLRSAILTSEVM
jgi:hypothetical protein